MARQCASPTLRGGGTINFGESADIDVEIHVCNGLPPNVNERIAIIKFYDNGSYIGTTYVILSDNMLKSCTYSVSGEICTYKYSFSYKPLTTGTHTVYVEVKLPDDTEFKRSGNIVLNVVKREEQEEEQQSEEESEKSSEEGELSEEYCDILCVIIPIIIMGVIKWLRERE